MILRHARGELDVSRPLIMGVLNVTPDSFSDGGQFFPSSETKQWTPDALDRILLHVQHMIDDGMALLDIGGESSRPYAKPVDLEEELMRVIPVVKYLSSRLSIPLSVDTRKARVAEVALEHGASIINDISAGQYDREMNTVVKQYGAGYILMHSTEDPQQMKWSYERHAQAGAIEERVVSDFETRLRALSSLPPESLAIDPGFGFSKNTEENVRLLRCLDRLCVFSRPIVVGISRKSFIGKIISAGGAIPEPDQRLFGSVAATVVALQKGALIFRTHDIRPTRDALLVWEALSTYEWKKKE